MNLKDLAAPFPAKDIYWRVGQRSEDGKTGKALPYISPRAVQDRLDAVCSPENWSVTREDVVTANRHVASRCVISIFTANGWVAKEDGAQVDTNTGSNAEVAVKGAYSDALKRAGVLWGIGRYLYAFQAPIVDLDEQGRMIAAPQLPPEMLPPGDTSVGVVAEEAPAAVVTPADRVPTGPAPAPEEVSEEHEATPPAAAPAVAQTPLPPASEPRRQEAAARTAPTPAPRPARAEAPTPSPAPVAAPVEASTPVPAPTPAVSSSDEDGEVQPYTDAELAAMPESERSYVKNIYQYLAKGTSLGNLKTYINGPKMQQNLKPETRQRLTRMVERAIGQQELSAG